ncbi:MAG: bactofilin family protein [Pyrinomonadaceae bacterium]
MIRMGRSKVEPADAPQPQERSYSGNANNLYGSPQETAPVISRGGAISESESMARDIKEGRLSGFVGHGTVLTGETTFHAMLRVDGHLTGRVTSENGTLIIGSSGQVDANILVAAAIINGTVNGDIIALEKVELGRTAQVVGNIQSPRLVIEDGAIFEGGCSMTKAKEALEQRIAESAQQYSEPEPADYESAGYADETEETETAAA